MKVSKFQKSKIYKVISDIFRGPPRDLGRLRDGHALQVRESQNTLINPIRWMRGL